MYITLLRSIDFSCSEDPDVKGTETSFVLSGHKETRSCSEDPDVKGTETQTRRQQQQVIPVAARIPM